MLTEARTAIKAALEAGVIVDGVPDPSTIPAGFKAYEYVGELLAPPCAAVVPAEPYVSKPDGAGTTIPFRRLLLGIDVLLISARDDAAKAAELTDELIEYAYRVLRPSFDVRRISRPGIVTISGAKFIGSVVTIEQLTEEP